MDFEHLLGLHTGTRRDPMPIAKIDPVVARLLGAQTCQVFLSAETVGKQLRHHRELPISVYRCVASCLASGSYHQDGPRSAIVLFAERDIFNTCFRAYIKATQVGHEIYLASFLMMRERDLKRELRKLHPIIRSGL